MSVNCDFACLYEYEESIGGGSRGARASSRWTAVPVPHGEVSSSRDMAGLHFRGRRWRYRLARRRLAAVSAESLLSRASNILVAPLRSLHGGLPWPQASSFTSALSNTADSSRGGPLGKVASGEDDDESDATRSGDAAQGSRVPMVDDLRWRWQVGSGGEQGPQARDTMGSPLTEASR